MIKLLHLKISLTFGIKERYDCVYWCEYMSENYPEIEEIILNGISMGATTILLASEFNLPSKVKGIVADCGFTSPKDIVSKEKKLIDVLAQTLITKETLTKEEIEKIVSENSKYKFDNDEVIESKKSKKNHEEKITE